MANEITPSLFQDIKQLIEATRNHIARSVNTGLVRLYWQIGHRIHKDILNEERAAYGKQTLQELARRLMVEYGSGFDVPNLTRMIKLVKFYPDKPIVVTLSQQLAWSHFVKLIAIDDSLKRDFYTEMCRLEGWDVRTLRQKVNTMLYERTAIAKQPESVIESELTKLKQGDLTNPDFYLQDPCILKFLYPKPPSSERQLEDAILSELQLFIQEIGSDFCFIARQKRMSTEKNDRFLDLLFFHRAMRRLIAIELKFSAFQPEHAGQMEWYLKWLDKYERRPGEEKPLGIIICADKDQEDIELLELNKNGIHVAQYLTELPPREVLTAKLHQAITNAQERIERTELLNEKTNKDVT